MSIFERRPQTRWLAPLTAVALAGGAALWPASAQAESLPERSAVQLLTDVQLARVDGLSGTLSETADLGLPALPASMGGDSPLGPVAGLASGTHTARVWVAGAEQSRVSVQDGAQESTVVRTATDLWQWQSGTQSATHYLLPAGHVDKHPTTTRPAAGKDVPHTPQEVAQQLVAHLSETSTVSTAENQTVAGRPAYELVLTPKTPASRVASVRIAVDGETHVPTRVQVFSTKTGTAAIEVGFTSVDFTRPAASVFAFTPAEGTKVTTRDLTHETTGDHATQHPKGHHGSTQHAKQHGAKQHGTEPQVVGTGWTSVVTGRVDPATLTAHQQGAKGSADQSGQLLDLLPAASGPWGSGRVLDGTLVSVVLTTDGRYAAGAVAPSALYAALPSR